MPRRLQQAHPVLITRQYLFRITCRRLVGLVHSEWHKHLLHPVNVLSHVMSFERLEASYLAFLIIPHKRSDTAEKRLQRPKTMMSGKLSGSPLGRSLHHTAQRPHART